MKPEEIVAAIDKSKALLNQLEPFLKRSEQWNVFQKIAGAVICLAGGVFLVGGIAQPRIAVAVVLGLTGISLVTLRRRIVEAEVFAVRDSDGTYRGVLSAVDRTASLILFDPESRPRMTMTVSDDGNAGYALLDENGDPRLHLAVSKDAGPTIAILAPTGHSVALAQETSDGGGMVTLAANDGTPRLIVSSGHDSSMVSLLDSIGVRASLSARPASAGLDIMKPDSAASIALKMLDDTAPVLVLRNIEGEATLFQTQRSTA